MSEKYKKEKDSSNFLAITIAIVILFFFSMVSAVISLNLPGIIFLFGSPYLPMSLTSFIFGLFVLFWGFLIVFLMRISKIKGK